MASLTEIMSEQLAEKLQQEETQPNPTQTNPNIELEPLDPDLELALKLSAQENQPNNQNLDDDFSYALTLQEEYTRNIEFKQGSSTSNVGMFRSNLFDPNNPMRSKGSNATNWDDLEDEEEEEEDEYDPLFDDEDFEDEEWEEEEEYDEHGKKIVGQKKNNHTAVKEQGRLKRQDFYVTKHDPVLNNKRNAALLEERGYSGNMKNLQITTGVLNDFRQSANKVKAHTTRVRGNKLDTTTSEQVMDQRTRVALLKLLNQDVTKEFHGIVSTGKEANVYHALAGGNAEGVLPDTEFAVKIYKTTLNEFKNRTEYLEDEHRFRNKTKSQNSKFIKVWAEKEFKNLKRLQKGGIPSPTPVIARGHILVMTFIGKEKPAPRLKEVDINDDNVQNLYVQSLMLLRDMFHKCRLVHADFSEYNLLNFKGKLHVIDVSQAVDIDHPKALEFLRRDLNAIHLFFRKKNAELLPPRVAFDFVTTSEMEQGETSFLEAAFKQYQDYQPTDQDQIDESVFAQVNISSSLKAMGNNYHVEPVLSVHKVKSTPKDAQEEEEEDTEEEDDDIDQNNNSIEKKFD